MADAGEAKAPAASAPRIAAPRAGPCLLGGTVIGIAEHVGIDFDDERVVMRQAAGGDELLHRHAVLAEQLDDPAHAERRCLEQRAVKMRRRVMQRESGEGAVQANHP